jgi:hypothetical protein
MKEITRKTYLIRIHEETRDKLDRIRLERDRWRKGSYDKILQHILYVYDNALEIYNKNH